MIFISILSEQGELTQTQDIELLKKALAGNAVVWLDLESPSAEELDLLTSPFHFHPLNIEDVRKDVGIPKIDVHDRYVFLTLHRIFYHFKEETCERREFEVFLGEHFLVTIHQNHLARTFATAREQIKQNPRDTLGRGTAQVFIKLLELAIHDYFPVIEQWQERLDEIESAVLRGEDKQILDEILQFKKLVATMRKNLLPEREILIQLYDRHIPWLNSRMRPYFKHLVDEMNALLHELDLLKEHAKSVFDVYAAMLTIRMTESSNQLNFVMQRLTIAATIFLPLTFLVGVYGMNFEFMPELHWKGGYYLIWALMLGIAGSLIYFFKKKKWL